MENGENIIVPMIVKLVDITISSA